MQTVRLAIFSIIGKCDASFSESESGKFTGREYADSSRRLLYPPLTWRVCRIYLMRGPLLVLVRRFYQNLLS